MIEQLHDCGPFRRVRIPLSDFIDFLPEPDQEKKNSGQATSKSPKTHFRCQSGFYLTTRWTTKFLDSLKPCDGRANVRDLTVWTLKEDAFWSKVHSHFEGKNHPVPWWVIRPFLAYATHTADFSLPSSCAIPFYMQGRDPQKDSSFSDIVALSSHVGAVKLSEWWLDMYAPQSKERCPAQQLFLSAS